MGTVAQLHRIHSPPLVHKPKPTHHCCYSLALGLETFLSSSPPSSLPRLSSRFSLLDDHNEPVSLGSVKMLHAHNIKTPQRDDDPDATAQSLIANYFKFGDLRSAVAVFLVGHARNYAVWNSFLVELRSFGGNPTLVLEVFCELYRNGVVFDSKVLTVILKVCAVVMELWLGLEIHAYLIKRGFDLDVYLKTALVNFYATCWGIDDAMQVFNEMLERGDLLWNEAVMVNMKYEQWEEGLELFRDMRFSSARAYDTTIVKVLQACGKLGALDEGKQVHGYVLRSHSQSNLAICNSLISMYYRNDKLLLARRVFDSMEDRNSSSWNSICSAYATLGYLDESLNLFRQMNQSNVKPDIITWNALLSGHFLNGKHDTVVAILRRMQFEGFKPNASSIISALQSVTELGLLNYGKEIHAYAMRKGHDRNVYVETSLIDMYMKSGCLTNAQSVFSNMGDKNIFAWNSLISGYSFNGSFEDAEKLLNQMEESGIKPDLVTWNGLLFGYSIRGYTREAFATIGRIRSSGLTPNVVSWTSLISGCSQNGKYEASFKIFILMQQAGVSPNTATISNLVSSCGDLSLLQLGKQIHCISLKRGFGEDVHVTTALIDMYSKSGDPKSAYKVFNKVENKTLASWNCMIMGFAIYGLGKEAISIYDAMRGAGFQPDARTFVALLSSCKNSCLTSEGWKYFDSMMKDYNIVPTVEHYSCMVDLLGRAGYLDEAWDFIHTMPVKPNAAIWSALLRSCKIHGNVKFGELAARRLFEWEPYNSGNYQMMMNLYAVSNRWEDVENLKDLTRHVGVKTGQVSSRIHIGKKIHVFAEGESHPEAGEIYYELYQVVSEIERLGYVPDVKCVYQNVDVVEKEKVLLSHTEKLAITYGLMKTRNGSPIRVIKNTRVCSDCHAMAKCVSILTQREIFLKDGVRFHYFKDGNCSCNDCW